MSEFPAPNPPSSYQNDSEFTSSFELLLMLLYPPKRVRNSNKKTKVMKPESENKGPYDVSINIGWGSFLELVANKLMVEPSGLVIASFEWHWLKPVSSPWLPVQDENRLRSMLKKVKMKLEPYVIIRMQVPRQRSATVTSETWDVVDEFDSDLEDNRVAKKVRIQSCLNRFGTQCLPVHSRRLS